MAYDYQTVDHSTASERDTASQRGTIMLAALVVLAVVASVIMLFSHSDAAMKIAVLAALWAAFIGLFMVSRYRRVAEEERERAEDQRYEFAEQLRQEQENFKLRQQAAGSTKDTELLEEIRSQLTELKAQLEELSGREFGYEPAALRAEARRIQEIEAVTDKVNVGTTPEPEPAEEPVEVTPVDETMEIPLTVPVTEPVYRSEPTEKQQVRETVATPQPAQSPEPAAQDTEADVQAEEPKNVDKPADTATPISGKERFNTGSFAAVKLNVAEPETPIAAAPEQPAPSTPKPAERHGRRRRDENEGGVSVAELLANLKKN